MYAEKTELRTRASTGKRGSAGLGYALSRYSAIMVESERASVVPPSDSKVMKGTVYRPEPSSFLPVGGAPTAFAVGSVSDGWTQCVLLYR